MTNDALAFVGHISTNQTPVWLQEVQAVAGIATTIGVLIALSGTAAAPFIYTLF